MYQVPMAYAVAIGGALNDYNGLLTGLATVFLSFITFRLVTIARDQSTTTRAQLRAYVLLDRGSIRNVSIGKSPRIEFIIKNYGQTPAYDVRHGSAISVGTEATVEEFAEVLHWPSAPSRQIGPGAEIICFAELEPLNNETWEYLKSGEGHISGYTKVLYRDAFGEARNTEILLFSDIGLSFRQLSVSSFGNNSN